MNKTIGKRILAVAIVLVGIFFDQLTKIIAADRLMEKEPFYVLPPFFRFIYVENKGSAFGMLADRRWVFMIFSIVAIIAITFYLIKKNPSGWIFISLSLILSGGIGNMIDRIFRGYVIDFIDFYIIDFAVFNVADSLVCIGAGILFVVLLDETVKEMKAEKQKKNGGGTP